MHRRKGEVEKYDLIDYGEQGDMDYERRPKTMGYMGIAWRVCLAILIVHMAVNSAQTWQTHSSAVRRYRNVAVAELQQECCKIFYNPYQSEAKYPSESIKNCQILLAEDRKKAATNRCEASQDLLKTPETYQVVLEMWGAFMPLGRISLAEYFLNYLFGGITTSVGWYFMKRAGIHML